MLDRFLLTVILLDILVLPILVLGIGVSVVFLALGIVVISVVSRVGAEKTAHIDQVANDSEENESSQKGKGSGGA